MCPNAGEPRPEQSIDVLEPWPYGPGTAENRELLAEGKVLQGQISAGTNQRAQGPEEGDENREHGGILPRILGPLAADRHAHERDGCDLARHKGAVPGIRAWHRDRMPNRSRLAPGRGLGLHAAGAWEARAAWVPLAPPMPALIPQTRG